MKLGREKHEKKRVHPHRGDGRSVVFSLGVLALLSLTGVLSVQLNQAGKSTLVVAEVQNRLDSLQQLPVRLSLPRDGRRHH